jgi:hypothetical protein
MVIGLEDPLSPCRDDSLPELSQLTLAHRAIVEYTTNECGLSFGDEN